MKAGVAFFDFDGTLVKGDSLMPFLAQVVGRRRARASLFQAARIAVGGPRTKGQDFRTTVKSILLQTTLKGVPIAEARAAAARMAGWARWLPRQVEALNAHRRAGHRIVIATGALGLYMPVLIAGLPVDDLLATDLECDGDILTGHMRGGNNVRTVKALRVQAYLDSQGPFAETWGYGNRPSDLPMLALLQNRVIV